MLLSIKPRRAHEQRDATKISKAASRACIGKHFGISGQAVGKWIYENGVPQKRIVPLCRFLNWEVTPHEIDPEAYPNPTDGLPKQEG
ncbi:helix-turn-helix domain-containing protein [Klebsiella variicola subsp. variicola]|nr:helix-turn-helix domain-containing protein [Klebsiella variicola subsp. variicola]MCS6054179.1 helix-turn-helix domain-containing protein [Klebsiella variicola subsp. variicola]